jgi:ribonuclease D
MTLYIKEEIGIAVFYHQYDLPNNVTLSGDLAVDTEAMGLNNLRDRLCVVQISDGNGDAHIVHYPEPKYNSPNLKKLLEDGNRTIIFHFARFDVAIIIHYLKVNFKKIFCTKIASRLSRTFTDQHGLKDLCSDLLGVKISKQQQSSDWGAPELTKEQQQYAANDVLHLHQLREKLEEMLKREGRLGLAEKCFDFIPTRAALDLDGWGELDIFHH